MRPRAINFPLSISKSPESPFYIYYLLKYCYVFETFLKSGKYSVNLISTKNRYLLMTDKFENNQIVVYFPGRYLMQLKPPVVCNMSHVLCLVSHATFQPFPNRKSQGTCNFCMVFTTPYVLRVSCHMSGVTCLTCHVSLMTCHMSCDTIFIFF